MDTEHGNVEFGADASGTCLKLAFVADIGVNRNMGACGLEVGMAMNGDLMEHMEDDDIGDTDFGESFMEDFQDDGDDIGETTMDLDKYPSEAHTPTRYISCTDISPPLPTSPHATFPASPSTPTSLTPPMPLPSSAPAPPSSAPAPPSSPLAFAAHHPLTPPKTQPK